MSALAELTAVIIDCANPGSLAEFYRKVTGWELTYSDENFAYLGDGPVQLAFQRIAGYQAPGWPDSRKHSHLEFKVSDVETTAKELIAIGASRPEIQPGGDQYLVLADPEGHVFCIAGG